MRTNLTEAVAHTRQLLQLGCSYEQAIADTAFAFNVKPATLELALATL